MFGEGSGLPQIIRSAGPMSPNIGLGSVCHYSFVFLLARADIEGFTLAASLDNFSSTAKVASNVSSARSFNGQKDSGGARSTAA